MTETYETADLKTSANQNATTSYSLLANECNSTEANLRSFAKIWRLQTSCRVYKQIQQFVNNSSDGLPVTIQNIYKIMRNDERDPFNDKYRIMLVHGTKPNCIPSIIQNGLKSGSGGAFGGGVYLADRIAKSMGYASANANGLHYFILAEVSPGRVYKAKNCHSEYKKPPDGFDSVKGMGSKIPAWKENQHYYGAILPSGKSTVNKRHPNFNLSYNEYIIYNADRIIVRFILECK